MMTLTDFINEQLKDPEFKKEWDASEEEYQRTLAKLKAEIEAEENVQKPVAHYPRQAQAVAV